MNDSDLWKCLTQPQTVAEAILTDGEKETQKVISAAVAEFPDCFGLYTSPGRLFRVNRKGCIHNGVGVMLSVDVCVDTQRDWWDSVGRGSVADLKHKLTAAPR